MAANKGDGGGDDAASRLRAASTTGGTLRAMRAAQMAASMGLPPNTQRRDRAGTAMPPPPPPPRPGTLKGPVAPVSGGNSDNPPPLPPMSPSNANAGQSDAPPPLPPMRARGTASPRSLQVDSDAANADDGQGPKELATPTHTTIGFAADSSGGSAGSGDGSGAKQLERKTRNPLTRQSESKKVIEAIRDEDAEEDEDEKEDTEPVVKYEKDSVAEGNVRTAKTIRVMEEKAENRFVQDFVPPVRGQDVLVDASLKNFSSLTKSLVRIRPKFKKVKPKRPKMQEYEVDISKEKAGEKDGKADAGDAKDADGKKADGKEGDNKEEEEEEEDEVPDAVSAQALLNVELIKNISPDQASKQLIEEQTKSREDGLFWRFHPEFDYKENAEVSIAKRTPVPLWTRDMGLQFLVTVQKLELHLGLIEPFFMTLALYDLKSGARLSENFHFDLNDASVLTGQMEVSKSLADKITLSRHAIFSVTDRHENVYLVLRIERVLQGDPADWGEIYLKPKKRTPADMQALSKKTRQGTVYLWEYRQTFAWGIVQVFEETGELKLSGTEGCKNELKIDKLWLQTEVSACNLAFDLSTMLLLQSMKDETMIALAKEVVQGKEQKVKQIPSSYFQLRIDELENLPANRVDPSSIALKDPPRAEDILKLPGVDEKEAKPIVKEIEEFPERQSMQPVPHTYFCNLLYVYPEQIKFEKYRNISCNVSVIDC